MPAFAQSAGGLLTDEQINVITSGLFFALGTQGNSRWKRIRPLHTPQKPWGTPHAARSFSDILRTCHGAEGHGGSEGSAIST